MRILIVNSEYPPVGGGAANASANLARELSREGQEVAVLTCQYREQPREEVIDGVTVHRTWSRRSSRSRSGPLEQFTFMMGAATEGLTFVSTWQPDVMICFFGLPSGPVGWLAKKLMGIPYLVSLRGSDVPGFRPYDFSTYHKIIAPLLRVIWREADHVVANSEGLKELAVTFAPHIPISVIPNGVDIERFQPHERDWSPPHLLFVGRIVYQKGLDLLFEALAGLQELSWSLTLVGDGPFLEELQLYAKREGFVERVTCTGWVDKEELIQYYQRANIFVLPSRHEGMSNALLEAMAMGLPVIASDIAGNEELVEDNKQGYLFPSNDVKTLLGILKKMIVDENKRSEMGARSRVKIVNDYSWTNTANNYFDLAQQGSNHS